MKLSLKWLRDFVDYQGSPDELANLLTFAGVEVEGVHTRGVAIDHVVVAIILDSRQHPNADRLSVCHVDDGSGQPPRPEGRPRFVFSLRYLWLPSLTLLFVSGSVLK